MNLFDNKRIVITLGEQSENHSGMEIHGNGLCDYGFRVDELENMKNILENYGVICEHVQLLPYLITNNDNDVNNSIVNNNLKNYESSVLVIRNGVDFFYKYENNNNDNNKNNNNKNDNNFFSEQNNKIQTNHNIFNELKNVKWDTKYYDTRRQKVLNKHARYNVCFRKEARDANYDIGQGTIVSLSDVPNLSHVIKNIKNFISFVYNGPLEIEGNYYYDVSACGIGLHGDSERKRTIGLSFGETNNLYWQWFYKNKPVSNHCVIPINHHDMYIMSEKATGHDWKYSSFHTLRHAAVSPYAKLSTQKRFLGEIINDNSNNNNTNNKLQQSKQSTQSTLITNFFKKT